MLVTGLGAGSLRGDVEGFDSPTGSLRNTNAQETMRPH